MKKDAASIARSYVGVKLRNDGKLDDKDLTYDMRIGGMSPTDPIDLSFARMCILMEVGKASGTSCLKVGTTFDAWVLIKHHPFWETSHTPQRGDLMFVRNKGYKQEVKVSIVLKAEEDGRITSIETPNKGTSIGHIYKLIRYPDRMRHWYLLGYARLIPNTTGVDYNGKGLAIRRAK